MHPPGPDRAYVGTVSPACLVLHPCVVAPPFLCLCILHGLCVMELGLISLGPHCSLQLSSAVDRCFGPWVLLGLFCLLRVTHKSCVADAARGIDMHASACITNRTGSDFTTTVCMCSGCPARHGSHNSGLHAWGAPCHGRLLCRGSELRVDGARHRRCRLQSARGDNTTGRCGSKLIQVKGTGSKLNTFTFYVYNSVAIICVVII